MITGLISFGIGMLVGATLSRIYLLKNQPKKIEITPGQCWEIPGGITYRILSSQVNPYYGYDEFCVTPLPGSGVTGECYLSEKQIRQGKLVENYSPVKF